ncbi:hypothetical protein TSOC_002546 [Tetrabaena socialis]|uniref:Thioesterase domain-containing protein n=1 Tax=Tetrabaena socialis TaxID=47790 RepID=A0A2J8ADS8_9CHLO|nr:hypothetical protein TSOC_002546 [Tetrabaena socialis]|eukprot:PNH10681.1 hypothetical protein TSOC_002546 [Tetrabaena socialis]
MASLFEVVDVPAHFPLKPDYSPPLLDDLTLASALTAIIQSLPDFFGSLPASARRLYVARGAPPPLAPVSWLRELESRPGCSLVLDRRGLTARGGLLPDDHLFKFLARKGLIRDNRVVWAPAGPPLASDRKQGHAHAHAHAVASTAAPAAAPTAAPAASPGPSPSTIPTVYNVYALSGAVCGHRGVVHGGLTSAIVDESFGYLLYLLASAAEAEGVAAAAAAAKRARPGAAQPLPQQQQQQGGDAHGLMAGLDLRTAMTAHLEVDYKRPLLAGSTVVCVTQVDRVEGRKVWLRAALMDRTPVGADAQSKLADGGEVAAPILYATGKALFVIPRPQGPSPQGTEVDV